MPQGLEAVPSAESSYEDVAGAQLPMPERLQGSDDGEDEEDLAGFFGDFDAEGFGAGGAEGPRDEALPVPILDGAVIDETCVSGGAAAMKLVWFFEELGSASSQGQHGLATVAVRHATTGELLVAVPGAFKPKPNLPLAPTGVVPRGRPKIYEHNTAVQEH